MKARLILEDGKCFEGKSFGAKGTFYGEVVLNNSMIGYQQVITDPANAGLIVCMTYPLVGNYGVNREDIESSRFFLKAIISREFCRNPSNFRSEEDLDNYLKRNGIAGIEGLDTRYLSRYLRKKGPLKGALTTEEKKNDEIIELLKKAPEENFFKSLSGVDSYLKNDEEKPQLAIIDLGVRIGFFRFLQESGFKIKLFPANVKPEEINNINPKALILAGGPGNPNIIAREIIANLKELIGRYPLLGISMGMQLFALAEGASLVRLKKEHRGEGYPVKDLISGRVYNTSQNRGFTIQKNTLPAGTVITHHNMHDGSIEGIKDEKKLFWGFEFWPYYSKTEQSLTPELPELFMNICRGGIQ